MNLSLNRRVVFVALPAALSFSSGGCGSKTPGANSNANGLAMLELGSGDQSDYRLNEDGSLTGTGFTGVMRKVKS